MSSVEKDIYGMITDYLDSYVVVYKDSYNLKTIDNILDELEYDSPDSIDFLIYLDSIKSLLLKYYFSKSRMYRDGLKHQCFEKVNNVYYKTRTLDGFALINKNKKYLIVTDNSKATLKEYCRLHPWDVINISYESVDWYVEDCGWQTVITHKLKCYSSPIESIEFVEKYRPKNYSIKTISYHKWFHITTDGIAGNEVHIKSEHDKDEFFFIKPYG